LVWAPEYENNALLALHFEFLSSNSSDNEIINSTSIQLGPAYFDLGDKQQNDVGAIFYQQGEGNIWIVYPHFAPNLVHDPLLGVSDFTSTVSQVSVSTATTTSSSTSTSLLSPIPQSNNDITGSIVGGVLGTVVGIVVVITIIAIVKRKRSEYTAINNTD